jgi:pimeloyl-CoA synthetase
MFVRRIIDRVLASRVSAHLYVYSELCWHFYIHFTV